MQRILDAINIKQFQGLIFDCDGTLADTMPQHFMAWQQVLGKHGISFDEDLFYAFAGQPTDVILAHLSKEQSLEIDVALVTHEKESAFLELLGEVEPLTPVVELAQKFHGEVPMGVGSGGQREVVWQILRHLKIDDLFGCVVGSEDTERHKPEPDVFLEVARRLEVPPEHCIVFEDADLGVEAARKAGMQCFDVRKIHTPRRLTQPDVS